MNQDDISSHIVGIFKDLQKNRVESKGPRTNVHVSHLTQECVRRPWYDFHEPAKPLTDSSICNFFLGHIVHENTDLGGRNEVPLRANITTMKPIEKKDITEFNRYDCISGTVDDILEIDGDIVIADKKTYNGSYGLKKKVDESYEMQLNIYKLLLEICEGKVAKYGSILYLNKVKSFQNPTCFTFPLRDSQSIRLDVLRKLGQLKMAITPSRIVTKWCNFCPHKKVCDPVGVPRFTSK